nr:MAG TPA: hypothetical protein [Caudoviricetes sp.]DAY93738.1 MAG TPA: hypothetical protein [Caudoviricetes sp.]
MFLVSRGIQKHLVALAKRLNSLPDHNCNNFVQIRILLF